MDFWLLPALLGVVFALLLLLLWAVLRRTGGEAQRAVAAELQRAIEAQVERHERETRTELHASARETRQELSATLATFQQLLLAQSGDVARTQNEQIDSFRGQLAAMQQAVSHALQEAARSTELSLRSAADSLAGQATAARDAQDAALKRQAEASAAALQRFGDAFADRLHGLAQSSEQRIGEMRGAVEMRLAALQEGNERKLEQMRATVDEKLHATLEQRLGESFRQVAERLEQVHRGLGEMQGLARDVGSLNRVLTNVKTRGIHGEMQLAGLLEQVMTIEQYAANVETVPGSGARVEFAIRLPGRRDGDAPLWLPIDAKFPRDDYDRLLDAHERADAPAIEAAARGIETRLRLEARSIRDKYLAAPHTTDFAILFLPTEGLYAEALRRPGLVESLHRDSRIVLAGPTTLLATLSSLQMGFRTLALEKRSTQVWEVLGAVKTEFAKFGAVLAKTKKKLDEASHTIDEAATRARAMQRELKSVEALPDVRARALLPGSKAGEEDPATSADGAAETADAATDAEAASATATETGRRAGSGTGTGSLTGTLFDVESRAETERIAVPDA